MNRQSIPVGYQEMAIKALTEAHPEFPVRYYEPNYYAWPMTFSTTAGPFKKAGTFTGQAFTTFTIEALVFDNVAVLFCQGKFLRIEEKWNGIDSVRMY